MSLPPDLQERFNRVKSRIFFEWEGTRYSISTDAYGCSPFIKLPNGTLLKVEAWTKSIPSKPYCKIVKSAVEPTQNVFEAEIDYTDCLG